jgi:hypothetical protein
MPHVGKAELSSKRQKTCGIPHVWNAKHFAKWGGHAACRTLGNRTFWQIAQNMRHAARLEGKALCQMGACSMPHVGKANLSGKWHKECGMSQVWQATRIAKSGHAACRKVERQTFRANGTKNAACRMFGKPNALPNAGMPHAACSEGRTV